MNKATFEAIKEFINTLPEAEQIQLQYVINANTDEIDYIIIKT